MNELKLEQTIEKVKNMIIDFGDGLLEFETKDITIVLNQLELQENYNDMLVRELEDLKAENEKMKVGLFQRNGAITDLDIENKELREENKHLYFTNDLLNDLQEQIKNDAGVLARGFAVWLLSNYNTSEEGMSLCWIDAENNTKHGTNELFDIYFRKLA